MIVAFLDKVKDHSHIRKHPVAAYAPAGEASSSPQSMIWEIAFIKQEPVGPDSREEPDNCLYA